MWDSLLLFVPPAAAVVYVLALLFRAAWLSQTTVIVTAFFTLGLGAFAVLLRRRPRLPTVRRAARLVDQKSGAKDHFLTLATIDPASQPLVLLTRLRLQTEGFLNRIELGRDFPYEFKRSAYWSLGVSLIIVILIHLLLPFAQSARYFATVQERLREIAQQMATKPDLKMLAKDLQTLASKLDDPKISRDDKQTLAQDMERKIEEQQKKEEQKDNRDLLGEAASALSGLEKQQHVASGQEQQKGQQKGGGGIQSNAPQDGQGENKQSQGGSGESKGESGAQSQEKMDQGKSAQANPKEQGQGKNQAGDAKNNQNQPDPNQPAKDPNKAKAGKTEGGSKDGAGKQKASEEPPPQGGPQAERFYKPGEGKEGLAAKGYVTVQMPEELVADAKGESRSTKESKNSRARTQVPVSNVPLPAHVPNAPTEKQQVPLEYRGIIR
ncbi:MAG: hypothetical protein ACREP3_08145 [Candidatus Binatia bacterium]